MGILQARIPEWVAMPSSRGSCQPRDWTQVSNIADGFFTVWATREYPALIILLIGGYVKLYVSVLSTGHAFFFSLSLSKRDKAYQSDDHYIYYCGQESLWRIGVALKVNKRVQNAVLGYNLKNNRMVSLCFQGKPFNITVIQVDAPPPMLKKLKLNNSMKTCMTF